MELSPTQNILGIYLSLPTREVFKRLLILEYSEFSERQLIEMAESLEQFTTPCRDEQMLFVLTEIVKHTEKFYPEKTLDERIDIVWEKEYEKTLVSREDLKQMYTNWLLIEKQWEGLEKKKNIEFTKDNQQLLETFINKQHNYDLENER